MKPGLLAALAVLQLALSSTPAIAAPITFDFTGRVTSILGADANVRYGGLTTFSGSYTFESTMADSQPGDATWGVYNFVGVPSSFVANLGGDVLTSSTYNAIAVLDAYGPTMTNEYFVGAYTLEGVPGATHGQASFELYFAAPFGSDLLPTTPPDVAAAIGNRVTFFYNAEGFQSNSIYGELTSLSVSGVAPIPEPETYALMLAGLGLLGVAARRRTAKETAARRTASS